MTQTDLSSPELVQQRLEEIEADLWARQNIYEEAARKWFIAKRDIERTRAAALVTSTAGSVTEKKAEGISESWHVENAESEAEYEALKSAISVLTTRATICMAILKSQGRA
jgi:hypothetical protein